MALWLKPGIYVAASGLCLFTGCGSSAHAVSTNLKALAVQASDAPRGFLRESGRYWSNAQAARRDHVSMAAYRVHGRVRSYADSYIQSGAIHEPPTGGLQRVAAEVTEFKSQVGARWGWRQQVTRWRHATAMGATTLGTSHGEAGIPVPFEGIAGPRIGSQAASFAATWGGDEFAYTSTALVFREGRFVAALETIGIMGQLRAGRAFTIAHRVDRRIAASA